MSAAPTQPDLGVVVVTYRSAEHIEACLMSLRDLVPAPALAVVDSASPDDTLERAARAWPGGRMVRLPGNLGYAAGVNAGLAALSQRFVLVLNPDTRVEPRGVLEAVAWLEHHPEFGLVGPSLVGSDGQPQASWFGPLTVGHMAAMYLLRDSRPPRPLREVDGALEVEGVVGAAMLASRAALAKVGPMDEQFFLYCEEVDWCARFRSAGYRLASLPSWRLTHLGGASTATLPVHSEVLLHRSRYLYFHKHGGAAAARLFQLLLLVTLPWVAAVAAVNGALGRISWREARRRVGSQGAAAVSPRPGGAHGR